MDDASLFEIVPNLSEGHDERTIDAAIAAVHETGAHVVHRTSDRAHHRSVLTIVGDGAQVLDASVALAGIAAERIDLRLHRGVHPRIGALDVLPFVPLKRATLTDAANLAKNAAQRIWERWDVPSFYYGAASPAGRTLAHVRIGEFEGLDARFEAGSKPDVGDIAKHPSAGAIAIGARPILIAFNVELETGDLAIAQGIARSIRERSGGLRTLRALGFRLNDDRVQVSMNVTDYHATPPARVVEIIRTLARELGVNAANGELIGCVPLDAVRAAAHYYLGVES